MTTNPAADIISEKGAFSLSTPVELSHFGGKITLTRAILSRLKESASQLEGAFSDSGATAWTLIPPGLPRVEFLTAQGRRWRVLDEEDRTANGLPSEDTVRLQLIDR